MSKSLIPFDTAKDLPASVTYVLSEMPTALQSEFLREYKRRSKDTMVAYLLHFFAPFHYAYLGKYFLQFVYMISFFGFGLWWFADLFRIPGMVQKANDEIAEDILRKVIRKHHFDPQSRKQDHRSLAGAPPRLPEPRKMTGTDDMINMGPEDLKVGYLADYALRTWQVKAEIQYDWNSGLTEKILKMSGEGEIQYLIIRFNSIDSGYYIGDFINIYTIDENFDKKILQNGGPANVLEFGDMKFFRENAKEGLLFSKVGTDTEARKVLAWDYMDQNRKFLLRIEQMGRNNFKAMMLQKVSAADFSDILPMN